MILNGVIVLISHYFTKFDSSAGRLRHMVEDRPTMSARYRHSVTFSQNWPTQQSYGLFATAKLFCR